MVSTRRLGAARRGFGVLAVALCALGISACSGFAGGPTTTTAPSPAELLIPSERAAVAKAESDLAVSLPTTTGRPAPTLAPGAFSRPLPAHQVVGFLPYWNLGFTPDMADLTTLAYWSVSLGDGGSIAHHGQGWSSLTNPSLGFEISQAHAAGTRVLLTVFSDTNSVVDSIAHNPVTAGHRLARQAAAILVARDFDGVDLDIEGSSTPDRAGFVRFVASFSKTLRSLGPRFSIMLDTYPTSAFDPLGFFNVKALMRYVDELFVMAYEMQDPGIASPTAPLTNSSLNDAMTLAEYAAVVPSQRVVLGIPLYGYDFATTNRYDGAESTGRPVAVTYSQIVAAGHRPTWDPVTETPVTVFRRNGKWHQTFFDDPVSIALKSALASQFDCAGVGVWELGMSGNDASVNAALLGGSLPIKLPLAAG